MASEFICQLLASLDKLVSGRCRADVTSAAVDERGATLQGTWVETGATGRRTTTGTTELNTGEFRTVPAMVERVST